MKIPLLQSELGQNNELLAFLLDYIDAGIALLSPEGRYTWVNQFFAGNLGYLPEELIGLHFSEITCPLFTAVNEVQFNRLISGEFKSCRTEKLLFRSDGRGVEVSVNLLAYQSADSSSQMIAAIYQNRSSLYIRYLSIIHPMLKRFIRHNPSPAVLISDAGGSLLYGSRSASEYLGYTEKEISRLKLTDIMNIDGAERLTALLSDNIPVRSLECNFDLYLNAGGLLPVTLNIFIDDTDRFHIGRLLLILIDLFQPESGRGAEKGEGLMERQILAEVRELKNSVMPRLSFTGIRETDGSVHSLSDYGLTVREQEVLALLKNRMSTKEIAYELSLAEITIRKHLSSIYQKFGVSCREDLLLLLLGSSTIQ